MRRIERRVGEKRRIGRKGGLFYFMVLLSSIEGCCEEVVARMPPDDMEDLMVVAPVLDKFVSDFSGVMFEGAGVAVRRRRCG